MIRIVFGSSMEYPTANQHRPLEYSALLVTYRVDLSGKGIQVNKEIDAGICKGAHAA